MTVEFPIGFVRLCQAVPYARCGDAGPLRRLFRCRFYGILGVPVPCNPWSAMPSVASCRSGYNCSARWMAAELEAHDGPRDRYPAFVGSFNGRSRSSPREVSLPPYAPHRRPSCGWSRLGPEPPGRPSPARPVQASALAQASISGGIMRGVVANAEETHACSMPGCRGS